MTEIWIWSV